MQDYPPPPVIDQTEFSLDEELLQLEEIMETLRVQSERLDPYFQQQRLMRQLILTEVKLLHKKLEFVRRFDRQTYTKRPTIVVAHHGTTWAGARNIVKRIRAGSIEPFRPSVSDGEWLGHGVYFWLMAPVRSASWGREMYGYRRKRQRWLPNLDDESAPDFVPVPTGQTSHFAVVEVRLRLFANTTINLLDQAWMDQVRLFYEEFASTERDIIDTVRAKSNYGYLEETSADGRTRNTFTAVADGPFRTRDCLFFNELRAKYPSVQSVMAAFSEGGRLFEDMAFGTKDHVQVCVFDQSIIDLKGITIRDAEDVKRDETGQFLYPDT